MTNKSKGLWLDDDMIEEIRRRVLRTKLALKQQPRLEAIYESALAKLPDPGDMYYLKLAQAKVQFSRKEAREIHTLLNKIIANSKHNIIPELEKRDRDPRAARSYGIDIKKEQQRVDFWQKIADTIEGAL